MLYSRVLGLHLGGICEAASLGDRKGGYYGSMERRLGGGNCGWAIMDWLLWSGYCGAATVERPPCRLLCTPRAGCCARHCRCNGNGDGTSTTEAPRAVVGPSGFGPSGGSAGPSLSSGGPGASGEPTFNVSVTPSQAAAPDATEMLEY